MSDNLMFNAMYMLFQNLMNMWSISVHSITDLLKIP